MTVAFWILVGFALLLIVYFWGYANGHSAGYALGGEDSAKRVETYRRSN